MPRSWTRLRVIADQGNPQVRFQLALSLGSLPISKEEQLNLAGRLLNHSKVDHWYETALLSSLAGNEYAFLKSLLMHPRSPSFLERLAQLASQRMTTDELLAKPELTQALAGAWESNQLALLRGLGRAYVQRVPDIAQRLKSVIRQQEANESDRTQAIGILSFLPWKETQSIFTELLNPISPPNTQQAALQAIKSYQEPDIAALLLKNWPSQSPALRRETQEVLFSRASYITYLLDRAEAGEFAWQQLDGLRREQLGAYKDASIKKRALALQAKLGTTTRKQVLDRYQTSTGTEGRHG